VSFIFAEEKKKVKFLTSTGGDPWVWVMGEHKDDKTIEQILEEEARQKATQQAKREAEELRYIIYMILFFTSLVFLPINSAAQCKLHKMLSPLLHVSEHWCEEIDFLCVRAGKPSRRSC
jgi:negative regulator of genetic competence, sporulation and motility